MGQRQLEEGEGEVGQRQPEEGEGEGEAGQHDHQIVH